MLTQSDGAEAASPRSIAIDRSRNRRRAPIRRLRLALAVLAIACGLAVIAQASWRSFASNQKLLQAAQTPLQMDKPRFVGEMKDGRTFLITADRAERDVKDETLLHLTKVTLVRGYGSPTPSQATADKGLYHENDHTLQLIDNVQIASAEGYNFASPTALIDTRTGAVSGGSGIQGSGPKGATQANAYDVADKGDRVTLKGRVRTRLEQRH